MTRILLAPDSFKGTLWAWEVCNILESGFRAAGINAEFVHLPLADGGEGTAQVLGRLTGAEFCTVEVTGPLGERREAVYALDRANARAFIDMASAAGLPLVPPDLRNPRNTTTYGVGELILDAIREGASEIIVGVGGSATVDGGIGCLVALGAILTDEKGNKISPGFGRDLHRIASADLAPCREILARVRLVVAADVQNPLLGSQGAAFVYGPQKGAEPRDVEELEQMMERWAKIVEKELGKDISQEPGMGASGGLAFGLSAIGGRVVAGAPFIARLAQLERYIEESDLTITGEGMLDARSFFGKVPLEVLRACVAAKKRCIIIAGKVESFQPWVREGAVAVVPVVHGLCAEPETREEAESILFETAEMVARLLTAGFPKKGGHANGGNKGTGPHEKDTIKPKG